jgi:predicted NAD/FAD-dependent oxidoreductase
MRVVVVGAGLAGLLAAQSLATEGHEVVVLEKRSVGGRLSTATIGDAAVDQGAQFFTVRSDAFGRIVDRWVAEGLVHEWCRGFGAVDGYPRHAVRGGMQALANHVAVGLDVRCPAMAFAVRPAPRGWDVGLDDGSSVPADALLVTCPVPQSLSLLITAGVPLPDALRSIEYDRTLAVLAWLDGPGAVPAPGGVQAADDVFSFVADNQAKGVSAVPALTLHVRSELSEAWWDRPREELLAELVAAARPWFGAARVVEARLARWRFATPRTTWPETYAVLEAAAPVVLAGDAFAGPRVEGAALSGLAAARAISTSRAG